MAEKRTSYEIALDVVIAAVTAALTIGERGDEVDLFKLENAVGRGIDEAGIGQFYVDIHK